MSIACCAFVGNDVTGNAWAIPEVPRAVADNTNSMLGITVRAFVELMSYTCKRNDKKNINNS